MEYYACLDIGGTTVKYGLADQNGRFLYKGEEATGLPDSGISHLLELVTGLVERCRRQQPLSGVAIDTAGIVDAETGIILLEARNFPGYTGICLPRLIRDTCGLPCTVENDVNAAGLGEYWLGAGQGASSLVCITIGTGIGGCLLVDGKLVRGISGSAGEIGYMHIENGNTDLEASASVPWLIKTVAAEKGKPATELDGRKIFDWAEQGDPEALRAIDTQLSRLALGINNICCLLNPELILLGGGITARREFIRPRLEAALQKTLLSQIRGKTRIDFTRLGNDAGMIGALRNFLDRRDGIR